jgi:tetratricopeptide (TPR) repeat protein
MRMKRFLAFSIGVVLPHLSYAQMEFANCHRFRDEESKVRNMRDSPLILQTMEVLVDDLRKLQTELRSPKPRLSRSLMQNCMQSKRGTLNVLLQQAPGSLRDHSRFNFLLGQSFEMTQDFANAYRYYLKAGQADPKDYASRVKAFENYNRLTGQRFRSRDQTLMPPTEVDAFLREVAEITEPLLGSDHTPVAVKTAVLTTRADLVSRLTGNKALAIKLWQRAYETDPKNLVALENLADYFYSRNATAEAKKYLEALIRLQPGLKPAEKLASIYAKLNDPEGYVAFRKQSSIRVLQSPTLKAMDSWAEARTGSADLAIAQAQALRNHPEAGEWAREALVTAHERRAEEFLSQGSPGKALGELDAALKIAPQRSAIRRSMARTLYQFAMGPSQKPESQRQDLQKAFNLLTPVLKDERPDAESLRLMALVADPLRAGTQGMRACEIFETQIGISQPDHMMACLRIAVRAKNTSWAKRRIDKAQANPVFRPFEKELLELNLALPDPL